MKAITLLSNGLNSIEALAIEAKPGEGLGRKRQMVRNGQFFKLNMGADLLHTCIMK
ncbi:MAG: hypothetical protein QM426_10860 [Euryarchaeota archaeon]|nr:hypothetical protein [Euryarchaeota archaeon]